MFSLKRQFNLIVLKLYFLSDSIPVGIKRMSSFLPSDYSVDKYNGVNIDLDKVSQSMPDATQDSAIFLQLLNGSSLFFLISC